MKTRHPLYQTFHDMKGRCNNPNNPQFKDYGGRGIRVVPRWAIFEQFAADMGTRPPGMTLDRIDNDGPYSPENCRWADRRTQQRNQRRAVYVEIEGTRYRAVELAEQYGLKPDTIVARAAAGLSFKMVTDKRRHVNAVGLPKAIAARIAKQRARTHCIHGHEFTPENTYFTPQGWRCCRTCQNEKMRRLNAAKRASQMPK